MEVPGSLTSLLKGLGVYSGLGFRETPLWLHGGHRRHSYRVLKPNIPALSV